MAAAVEQLSLLQVTVPYDHHASWPKPPACDPMGNPVPALSSQAYSVLHPGPNLQFNLTVHPVSHRANVYLHVLTWPIHRMNQRITEGFELKGTSKTI